MKKTKNNDEKEQVIIQEGNAELDRNYEEVQENG